MSDDPRIAEAAKTTDLPGYKLGKALLDSARPQARNYTSSFYEDQRFALGENQWPTPNSFKAWWGERWKNRNVRNYTFAVINFKIGSILGQKPTVRCVPLDEIVSLQECQD